MASAIVRNSRFCWTGGVALTLLVIAGWQAQGQNRAAAKNPPQEKKPAEKPAEEKNNQSTISTFVSYPQVKVINDQIAAECARMRRFIGFPKQPLAAALQEAQAKAVRLLTTSTPAPAPHAAPKPVPRPGRTVLRQGAEQHLTLRAAQDVIARLEHELQAGQDIRFTLSWIIEEGGSTQ